MKCKWSGMRVLAGFSFLFKCRLLLKYKILVIVQLDQLSEVTTPVLPGPSSSNRTEHCHNPRCPLASCPGLLPPLPAPAAHTLGELLFWLLTLD